MSVLDGKIAIVTGTSRGVGVGIAHELLRAGATVVGVRVRRWTPSRASRPNGRIGLRKRFAIKAISVRSIFRHRGRGRPWPDRHFGEQRRRYRPGAARGEHSRTRATHSGRAPRRRRVRTHRTVSRFRGADEPDQSTLVCHPRVPADAHPGRHRLIINISSGAGHPAGRRRWSPMGPPRAGSTISPARWPRSGDRRSGSTASHWGRR